MRLHRASGQARCRIDGKDVYLGVYGSARAQERFAQLLDDWHEAHPEYEPAGPTVGSLAAAWLEWSQGEYSHDEFVCRRAAIRRAVERFCWLDASAFGPEHLEAIQRALVAEGKLCRAGVNRIVMRIRSMFKWAVKRRLVTSEGVTNWHAMKAVEGVRPGRAPDRAKIQPVSEEDIERTLPELSETLAAMVTLQWRAGMRPAEVCGITTDQIDRSAMPWIYRPRVHKNTARGKDREVALGPRACAIIADRLDDDRPADPLFWTRARRRGSPPVPYTTDTYRVAIHRACDRAFPAPLCLAPEARGRWVDDHRWSPNQLRHARATEIRTTFDPAKDNPVHALEVVGAVLGHDKTSTTEIYAARRRTLAAAVAMGSG